MSVSMFFAIAFFALMALGAIIGAFGQRGGSYLWNASQGERAFRRPLMFRLGGAMMGSGMLLFPFMFADQDWGAVLMFLLMTAPVAALMLWLSGPDELHLNLADRTFRRVKGWPFFPVTRLGTWAGIWGVYVGRVSSTYFVGLRGVGLGGRVDLGRFGMYAAAEQFAQQLMSELSLPQVPPPKPLIPPTVSRMKAGR